MSTQISHPAPALKTSSIAFGDRHLVDCPADELPLTESELHTQFGVPIIVKGIDLTAVMQQYLDEIAGQDIANPVLPELRFLADGRDKAEWLFGFRLLMEFDKKSHKKAGIPKFQNWVAMETDRTCSGSTLYRNMAHARVALVFAAAGLGDTIPSQNTSVLLQRHLPRKHWVRFWKQMSAYAGRKLGADKFKSALEGYSYLQGVRLLQPIQKLPVPKQQDLITEKTETATSESQIIERLRNALNADPEAYFAPATLEGKPKRRSNPVEPLLRKLLSKAEAVPRSEATTRAGRIALLIQDEHPTLADRLVEGVILGIIESLDHQRRKSKTRLKIKRRPPSRKHALPSLPG